MSTFLHGVGTVQFLDKSAEVVDLKGLDITSLAKTGIINYEHHSDVPAQLVGKILKAKKIFSKEGCSNEHETHFWNKVKVPYLYIMAELLDDYCDSAKHVAGVLKYDRDKKDQNEYAIMWFSVEGSEIPGSRANKQTVSRGIARKVTLTSAPCNQGCAAEILENQKPQIKDDFDSLFRSEQEAITLFKSGEGEKIYLDHLAKKEPSDKGPKLGSTKSGKDIYSHGKVADYDFDPSEHKEAAEHHRHAAVTAEDSKSIDNHMEKMKLHNSAALALDSKKKASLEAASIKKGEPCDLHKSFENAKPVVSEIVHSKPGDVAIKNKPTSSSYWTHDEATNTHKFSHPSGRSVTIKDLGPFRSDTDRSFHVIHHKPPKSGRGRSSQSASGRRGGTLDEAKKDAEETVDFALAREKNNAIEHKKSEHTYDLPKPKLEKSDKPSWSAGKTSKATKGAVHFSHPEHGTVSIQKQPSGEFHVKHQGKLAGLGGKKGIFSNPEDAGKHAKNYMQAIDQKKIMPPKMQNISSNALLAKALTAGNTNAAPSTLVNGAAYQTESLGSRQATTGAEEHSFKGSKKKDWNKRAKDDYENWPHRQKYEAFMKARMPHLHEGEIRALGRALALKKSIEMEKSLRDLVSLEKADSKAPYHKPHFLFSAEKTYHPDKNESKMDHKQTLAHLKSKGYNANEVKGHYGSPETSIMVHSVSPKQAEHLHGIASKLGQDSSIYSTGKKHEMRYHHGKNAGKSAYGEGTVEHKEKPKDSYTTLPNGQHFTHNLDTDNLKDTKPVHKSEDSQKKNEKIDLVHYSSHPNLKEVDPKHHGSGIDSRTKGRDTWHPHSFYYRAGTEPEAVVTGRAPHKYDTQIDTQKQPIYDIGADKEGHVANSANMDAAHEKIKEKGYHGFHNSKHDSLSHVVAMYHPLKVNSSK